MMMGLEKSRNLELHGREEIECMFVIDKSGLYCVYLKV
jgi:hypothetical protein